MATLHESDQQGQFVDVRPLDVALNTIGTNPRAYMFVWHAVTRWVQNHVHHEVDLVAWYGERFEIMPREITAPDRSTKAWWTLCYDRRPRLYPTPRAAAVAYVERYFEHQAKRRTRKAVAR